MPIIELRGLKKSFDNTNVLKEINLTIQQGEFITLLGPSGCGKTTTLRIIGGFETPDAGKVLFQGEDITDLPPHRRPLNTLFQQYSLFPHLNVFDNVAFGLSIRGIKGSEIKNSVEQMLSLVNLSGFEKRGVDSLSGGQKQRVAMARALILKPQVFLLDEPLGALDLKLRKGMQAEFKRIQQELGITFIYVTHDQEEALTLSDRIVVMNEGVIQQIGTPIDIYNEPLNAYVADFVGESNILEGMMHGDYDVTFSGGRFTCVDTGFRRDEAVDVVVRPEDLELVAKEAGMIRGRVTSSIFMGVHYEMNILTDHGVFLAHSTEHKEPGVEVGIRIIPDNIHIMRKGEVEGDEDL